MYLVLEIEHRHADKILLHIWNPFKLDGFILKANT